MITAQDISDFAPDLDTSAYTATQMSGIISQAVKRAASFCSVKGFDLRPDEDNMKAVIDTYGELHISTYRKPIISVSSITLKKGSFSSSLTLQNSSGVNLYHIPDPGNKVVFPNSFLVLAGTYLGGGSSNLISLRGIQPYVDIVYTAGLQTCPDDLKYALVLYVRDYIANKKVNSAGVSSFSQGSYSVQANQGKISTLVMEAQSILQQGDYVRPEAF